MLLRVFFGLQVAKYTWFSKNGDTDEGLAGLSSFLCDPRSSTISIIALFLPETFLSSISVGAGTPYSNFCAPVRRGEMELNDYSRVIWPTGRFSGKALARRSINTCPTYRDYQTWG